MAITINGTTGIAGVDGSAGTPAVQGTDTNTGVFYPAADTVGVSTGGSERMRVDSSGNVGIGTSSPSQKLTIKQAGDGNLASQGIGILASGSDTQLAMGYRSDLGGVVLSATYVSTGSYQPMLFRTSDTERMRIDSSGNLLVGATTIPDGSADGVAIRPGASRAVFSKGTTSSASQIGFFNPNGLVGSISTSASATSYSTSSDYRLKENVQPMTGALAKVAALNPCTYTWKSDGSAGQGFIAHELAEVEAGCVTGEKDAVDENGNPVYQGIDTSFLVATLTAAIQEQQALIQQLQADVAALKGTS